MNLERLGNAIRPRPTLGLAKTGPGDGPYSWKSRHDIPKAYESSFGSSTKESTTVGPGRMFPSPSSKIAFSASETAQ